jgi:flagellar protein FliL
MAATPEEKTEKKEKKKFKLSVPWIVAGALAIVILGYASYLGMGYFLKARSASAAAGAKGKPQKVEVKTTFALDPFLVNLADKEEVRFVKATFQLGLAEEMAESPNEKVLLASIRDSIIALLSSKTAEDILSPEGKEKLREQIRARVNVIAPALKVQEVYIVDFVVQL